MLGQSLLKVVQVSEEIRQNLPGIGSHAKHDLQALEDEDKPELALSRRGLRDKGLSRDRQ